MSVEMTVPVVGESITEVTIAQWIKKDGDSVAADEILCELESDKATFELTAQSAGVLRIVAQAGETLPIGAVLCRIESSATLPSAVPNTPAPNISASTENKVFEMRIPAVGESINEVTVANWLKKDGDFVEQESVICEIDSDKATFELQAEASGILRIVAQKNETLSIGALLCRIEGTLAAPTTTAAPVSSPTNHNVTNNTNGYATGHASPAAAKILAEKGISPQEVQASGVAGRITKEDALKAQPQATEKNTTTKTTEKMPTSTPPTPAQNFDSPFSRDTRTEKMSSLRKTVAKRLVSVKNETAMLTTFNEIDMKGVMDLRAKYKDIFKEKHEIGLGFMSFFVKACCVALQEFPAVNAIIDGENIIYHQFCDVSIAVSAPKGLVVPVVRNAESLSLAQIEKAISGLAKKARENKLSIPEMTGGTFTITNGGVFGSLMSTPIINAPQSAILGMHNIVERPVAVQGQVVIRPMMYIALSYDHRIIDGRESVSFLVRVKQLIEDPARLLLMV